MERTIVKRVGIYVELRTSVFKPAVMYWIDRMVFHISGKFARFLNPREAQHWTEEWDWKVDGVAVLMDRVGDGYFMYLIGRRD